MDAGADFVNIAVDTGRTGEEVTFTVDELKPTVHAVHERGKRITAHAQGLGAAWRSTRASTRSSTASGSTQRRPRRWPGTRRSCRPSACSRASWASPHTDGGRFAEAKGASAALLEQALAAVRVAKKAGVRIATGSDFGGGSVRPGHLAWEVEMLVRAGLEPHEALASATWIGGELLAVKDAGTVHEGGPADVVLVHGDPLSDPAAYGASGVSITGRARQLAGPERPPPLRFVRLLAFREGLVDRGGDRLLDVRDAADPLGDRKCVEAHHRLGAEASCDRRLC